MIGAQLRQWVNAAVPGLRHFLVLFRWEKRLVARFLFTMVGRTLAVVLTIYLIQEFLAGMFDEAGGLTALVVAWLGKSATLWVTVGLLLLAYAAGGLFSYDNSVVQQRIIKHFELGIMERLMRHLLRLSVLYINQQSPGDLIQVIRQDVSHLRVMVRSAATLLIDGLTAVGLIVTAFWISPWLAFWALCVLPPASLPIVLVANRIRSRSFRARKHGYVVFDIMLQLLTGIRVIRAYRAEGREAALAVEKGNLYFDEMIAMTRLRALAQILLELLAGLGVVLVILVGTFQVQNGSLTWAGLLTFLLAARALNGPFNSVYSNFMDIQMHAAAVRRISEVLETRPEVTNRPGALPLKTAPRAIAFENVGFSYGEAPVLRDLTFTVRRGETLAIVGPSGAGKSTLLNLFVRFYDPTEGRVCFDGRPLDELRLADVYDQVAIVTQEPFLFATSVRDNIRIGRPSATDAEVEEAARAAYIHEDILPLPQGYDTVIGIGGRALSRGQMQRVNLARAFLKNAPILLLDEATSSLDCVAEAEIQWALDRLMEGRTNIVVTHHFGSLRHVDRVLVLEHGRLAGLGTHDELMRDCPLYQRMWQLQGLAEMVS